MKEYIERITEQFDEWYENYYLLGFCIVGGIIALYVLYKILVN